jgi:ketosteroid isomerase-like protein
MAATPPVATRAIQFFRLLDAKDETALRAQLSEDPQTTDEITRGWLRGRAALEAYFVENLPRITEIHSLIDEVDVRRWGDVEVETFVLRQGYVYDGTRYDIEAPTTMIWRREGETWKLALMHSIPLPPAT